MAATVETKDIPRENLFMVGIRTGKTTRDGFTIARPRRPFIINRAESLNLIGYMVTMADFTVKDIEDAITMWEPRLNLFNVRGDDRRVMIEPPTGARVFHPTQPDSERDMLLTAAEMGIYLFGIEEGKLLAAALVRVMELKPVELDRGVIAIFDHARNPSGEGESEADVRKGARRAD